MPLSDYAALVAGLVCAGIGGEVFVRGAVTLAHWARVSAGIVGATVAAFATSSPELSVSVSSALAGKPQIALGDALGSNVVNVALVLALALLVSGLRSSRDAVWRDFPVALMVPVITGALFVDGVLSRLDGVLLLGLFTAWLVATVVEARRQRKATQAAVAPRRGWAALMSCIAGLGLLVAAGRFIVAGARGIAVSFGVDEFVIGATVVAIGTSVPELATAMVAALRGHSEVGLGTILGSNIFNGLFIIGVAAVIHPIAVDWHELAVALGFGLLAVALTFPTRGGVIERRRGVLLLVLYGMYLSAVIVPKVA
jgi:cation:H+ antiporter